VITSGGGLLAYRELDDVLTLTTSGGDRLAEARAGKNRRHLLVGLLTAAVGIRAAGRIGGRGRRRAFVPRSGDALGGWRRGTNGSGCFATDWPGRPKNLADLPGQWIDAVHQRCRPSGIVLDMDSSECPTYGAEEGSAYNVHFGCTCNHPLFVFNQLGDLERCVLRSGNVHSATGWREVLEPMIARYRGTVKRRYFRGDAAFASPEIYEFLPANPVLQNKIGYLLKRPVGRPPQEVRRYSASFRHQAGSWNKTRRVVAKVKWHSGELYPRVGSIVTNLARLAVRVVAFYNQRGTAEPWSLTSCREKLIKIAAMIVSHGRNVTLPDGRGRGDTTDVSRHSVAHLAPSSASRASMTGRSGQLRQTTAAAEVRPIGQSSALSASWRSHFAISTAYRARGSRFCAARDARGDDPCLASTRNPGNVG
jgi:hypothetical protein